MQTHNLIQGSPEWHAYRREHFNASDAPAMMGCSPYKTRAQLLREMATGLTHEVDAYTQRRFDDGHRFEALARPLAESIIGQDLYPITGSLGEYSASFDGITMGVGEDIAFEHKTLSAALHDVLHADIKGFELPLHYRVQMEQQCMVSGAGRVLFMASNWNGDELVEQRHCWYRADSMLREQIVAGWAQFKADLAAYVPEQPTEPAPVGKAPDLLPALRIEVTGMVTASNLDAFRETALAAIRGVNRELQTDADFADAEKAVKWCGDVESRLAAAKEHALSQTASIDELFKTIDAISAEARSTRLDLDKLVTRRKTEVKESAILKARKALQAHVAALNGEIAPMQLRPVDADFAGAIKGKRTLTSVHDALDTLLAQAKIDADAQARAIRANIAAFKEACTGVEFLFADLGQLVHKPADDFALVLQARLDAHKVAEDKKEEARKAADAALKAAAAPTPAPAPVAAPAHVVRLTGPATAQAAAVDEPATLKLGDICGRLGLTMTAAFVIDTLGIKPARTEGVAKLFTERQFVLICAALRSHVGAMAQMYVA